jgi:hypothetical protein
VLSLLIVVHLVLVIGNVFAVPSGPWPGPDGGANLSPPPQFAQGLMSIFGGLGGRYLNSLRMTSSYHFLTNRPGLPDVYIEARLKEKDNGQSKTMKLPDPNSNFWVQHRQSILAAGLRDDVPVQPPQGEGVAAPGRQVRTVLIWEPGEGGVLKIVPTQEHLIPRDRPVWRPGDWPRLLARSYGRYLCRSQNAASADIIRHWRNAIPPSISSMGPEIPQQALEEYTADFGEVKE